MIHFCNVPKEVIYFANNVCDLIIYKSLRNFEIFYENFLGAGPFFQITEKAVNIAEK